MYNIGITSGGSFVITEEPPFVSIIKQNNNEETTVWVAAEPAQSDDEKNVSDGDLADLINVSRQTVNNWINGRRDITVGRLHEVANALGVRVRDLFDE